MNGKRAKKLRRIAESKTVGMPKGATRSYYNFMKELYKNGQDYLGMWMKPVETKVGFKVKRGLKLMGYQKLFAKIEKHVMQQNKLHKVKPVK